MSESAPAAAATRHCRNHGRRCHQYGSGAGRQRSGNVFRQC